MDSLQQDGQDNKDITMPITSIQRDTNNNVSLVRMISTDSLAAIDGTNYIELQQENINQLNGGTWQWFITDMILCAADDGNAFFEFIDDTFTTLTIFGSIGSGIINPGMTNQLPYYSANGRVLSPLTNMANAILATNGSMVPGLTQTLPTAVQTNITNLGTVVVGAWNATPVTVPFGGSGLSSLTAYAVLCGGTTNTGNMQQVSGLGTSGQLLTSNGPGLLPTWQASPGSGTVSPGLQNQVAYYAANGSTVSGLTSIASGVLITSGLGVPSISQTLPSAVQLNITSVGTVTAGTWQADVVGSLYGGTGLASPTAHGIMIGEGASPMTPIVLTSGQILIGSTGVDPVAAAISSGTGILVGNGAGSITVSLANANNNTIKSNISGISAAPVDNTLTAIIDSAIGSTQGNTLYRNATIWTVLAPGTAGQVLTTGGAAADPSWASSFTQSLTSAHLFVGNGSNIATDVAVSGDLTLANTGAFTIANSAVTNAKLANMNDQTIKGNVSGGAAAPSDLTATQVTTFLAGYGDPVIQRKSTETGAVATGSTVIPVDDTIPQKTEGDEYMTVSITPKNSSNILKIDVNIYVSTTAAAGTLLVGALFQDSNNDSLACGWGDNAATIQAISFSHTMTAGTTSATTFKIRAGAGGAGTTTFNGISSARFFGGVLSSSITVTEYSN